jgi:hypothetical protein
MLVIFLKENEESYKYKGNACARVIFWGKLHIVMHFQVSALIKKCML